jgi:hypothetical protein
MIATARTAGRKEVAMPSLRLFDPDRRILLIASGALGLAAVSHPARLFAQPAGGKLRIGTIGAGRIGGTVGTLWARAGHPVMFSSKSPQEGQDLAAKLGPPARAGTVSEAIDFGEAAEYAKSVLGDPSASSVCMSRRPVGGSPALD